MTICKYCGKEVDLPDSPDCNNCWEVMSRIDSFLENENCRLIIIEKLKKYGFYISLIADYYIYEMREGNLVFYDTAFTEEYADCKIKQAKLKKPNGIFIKKATKK